MKHSITIDGEKRDLDIRAMDETFIMYDKLWKAPLRRQDLPPPELGTTAYTIQEFLRRQVRAIGSCLILAWDGDGLVGKMHFTTRELAEALGGAGPEPGGYCVDPYPTLGGCFSQKLQAFSDEELERLLGSESRTLRVVCFNIANRDPRYHGQGIATALLEYLKVWAKERRWQRLEMRTCPDVVPASATGNWVAGPWILRRGPLERRGFRVLEEIPREPEEVHRRHRGIEEAARAKSEDCQEQDMLWHLESFRRIYADERRRSEYDRDYLMVCDL